MADNYESIDSFNNICRQEDTSREKRIAYHQLTVKDDKSYSLLMIIRRILHKYGLPNPITLLDEPITKIEQKKNKFKLL